MEISAHWRKASALANILLRHLEDSNTILHTAISEMEALDAIRSDPTITVSIVEGNPGGSCSVAGTCDVDRRIIAVTRSNAGRMRYSVLHELAHLLMADCDEYHDAFISLMSSLSDRQGLTEDVCEAFAALLLLPTSMPTLQGRDLRLDASGLRDLAATLDASREACAVWVAQRMTAPGYALICGGDGVLQFAARSGDAIPISRGASQLGSGLQPLVDGQTRLRGRERLRFGSGSTTDEMYIDAVRDGGLIFAIATTDSPAWPVLHQPVEEPAIEQHEGWCEQCATSFKAYRLCAVCGTPPHPDCGNCDCETTPSAARVCTRCFLERHISQFDSASTVCKECAG